MKMKLTQMQLLLELLLLLLLCQFHFHFILIQNYSSLLRSLYAELAMQTNLKDKKGKPAFHRATHFVSHAWRYDFGSFVDALGFWIERRTEAERERIYFWIRG